ncbi:MAG: hypothetical protein C0503_00800 [Gemmatimonas sp.]|nr:hypothetical protein [Gemmatimonas sp.]
MSYSQHEADLITENRELRQRLQGAIADLEAERLKNLRAAETHARMDLKLQQMTADLRVAKGKLERAGIR